MRAEAQESGNHVLSSLLLYFFSPTEYIFFSVSMLKYYEPLVGLHVHLPLHVMLGSGLRLHRACSSCYNLCEFICTAALLCPENAFPCVGSPLMTFTVFILPPTLQQSLTLERSNIVSPQVLLRAEHSALNRCTLPAVGLCTNHHASASLLRAGISTDRWG